MIAVISQIESIGGRWAVEGRGERWGRRWGQMGRCRQVKANIQTQMAAFVGGFFSTLSNHEGAFHGLCGPRWALIRLHGVSN